MGLCADHWIRPTLRRRGSRFRIVLTARSWRGVKGHIGWGYTCSAPLQSKSSDKHNETSTEEYDGEERHEPLSPVCDGLHKKDERAHEDREPAIPHNVIHGS